MGRHSEWHWGLRHWGLLRDGHLPELWPTSHRIFVCHRAEGRHWFEEALVAALAHQVMPTHVLQSWVLITCSHCSRGAAACQWCLCHGSPAWLVSSGVEFTARHQPCLAYRDKHFSRWRKKYWNGKITAGGMPSHLSCCITVSVFDYWSHKDVIFFMLLKQLPLLYLICPFRREQE